MTDTIYIGVDGGGTKTAFVAVDEAGTEVSRLALSTSNAAVIGHEAAGKVLQTGLEKLVADARATLGGVWLGLSGSDRPEDHRRLKPHIAHLTSDIRMSNDAELALAALPNQTGLVVVAGTGSIAFGYDAAGKRARSGGWGQILGDEGSGYDLARLMLQAFTAEVDGRGPATACYTMVMEHLQLEEPFQLIQWVYDQGRTKGDIAALSAITLDAADTGDAVAQRIVIASAGALAHTALAAARRLELPSPLPLALTGGLLTGSERFRSAFLDAFGAKFPSFNVRMVTDPALTAAQALADVHMRMGTT